MYSSWRRNSNGLASKIERFSPDFCATFFVAGSTVRENYDCTISYVAASGAPKITRTANDGVYFQSQSPNQDLSTDDPTWTTHHDATHAQVDIKD